MIVWNDIEKYKKGIDNTKKEDGLNENDKLTKNKTSYNKNAFHINHNVNDYGLNDKVTIKPFHVTYDQSFKNMFKNKSTPSNFLKGSVELSSGTRRVIEMTNKMIPKIDHSYVDPQYYEHKLEGKTNKVLMLNEMSGGKDFAKRFIEDMKSKELPNTSQLILKKTDLPDQAMPEPPIPEPPKSKYSKFKRDKGHLLNQPPPLLAYEDDEDIDEVINLPPETKRSYSHQKKTPTRPPPQSPIQKIGLDIKSAIPPSPIRSKAEIKEAIQRDPKIQ